MELRAEYELLISGILRRKMGRLVVAPYTKNDALAFVDSIRILMANRTGFKWLMVDLDQLTAYIESSADENESMKEYLQEVNGVDDFEKYCSRKRS